MKEKSSIFTNLLLILVAIKTINFQNMDAFDYILTVVIIVYMIVGSVNTVKKWREE